MPPSRTSRSRRPARNRPCVRHCPARVRDALCIVVAMGRRLDVVDAVFPPLQAATELRGALTSMRAWVEEIPPLQQPMRYGNKAYRTWHARLLREGPAICERVLQAAPGCPPGAATELASYLFDSFGNATRIDYGTGHETSFILLLRASPRPAARLFARRPCQRPPLCDPNRTAQPPPALSARSLPLQAGRLLAARPAGAGAARLPSVPLARATAAADVLAG
jgi:hypothetical protein